MSWLRVFSETSLLGLALVRGREPIEMLVV